MRREDSTRERPQLACLSPQLVLLPQAGSLRLIPLRRQYFETLLHKVSSAGHVFAAAMQPGMMRVPACSMTMTARAACTSRQAAAATSTACSAAAWKAGLTACALQEMVEMMNDNRNIVDPFGWFATVVRLGAEPQCHCTPESDSADGFAV